MTLRYPIFSTPRLAGADGTIGGVLIQQLPARKLVGGVLLQNAPGFDQALEIPLLSRDDLRLSKGRYALTLLGTARQSVTLQLPKNTSMALTAQGAARPVTDTSFASSMGVHRWADRVDVPKAEVIVVLGSGSGGRSQLASHQESCFRPAADDAGLCLDPTSSSLGVAPNSWGSSLYRLSAARAGSYSYSGRVAGVGIDSDAAHSRIVITMPR